MARYHLGLLPTAVQVIQALPRYQSYPSDRNAKLILLLFTAVKISEWSFPRPFIFGREEEHLPELTWACPSDTLLAKAISETPG